MLALVKNWIKISQLKQLLKLALIEKICNFYSDAIIHSFIFLNYLIEKFNYNLLIYFIISYCYQARLNYVYLFDIKINSIQSQKVMEQLDNPEKANLQMCSICCMEHSIKEFSIFSQCLHKFCVFCINSQIKSDIAQFKPVKCLQEGCKQILQIGSPFIEDLTIEQQERYYKILIFSNQGKNQSIKLCPLEGCEGFIDLQYQQLTCALCNIEFCRKCLNFAHDGQCEENGVQFLELNYQFKKCSQCKMVLQKSKGCNHMTCRCGFQFCYVCGIKWSQGHRCNKNKDQRQIERLQLQIERAQRQEQQINQIMNRIYIMQQQRVRPLINPVSNNDQGNQGIGQRSLSFQRIERRQNQIIRQININQNQNQAQIRQMTLCRTLKRLSLIVLCIILLPFWILGQILMTIGLLLIYPLFILIGRFCISFCLGWQKMMEYQCWKIVLGNVFLYLFCTIYEYVKFIIYDFFDRIKIPCRSICFCISSGMRKKIIDQWQTI